MNEFLLLALFFVAIGCGWLLGKREFKRRPEALLPKDYWVGVNHLLNEQHDEAIDVFIKALRVDEDILETQLALAGVYRKRGEVDKAIAVHEQLLTQIHYANIRASIELELARDYLKAGLLDRAEIILQQLSAYTSPSQVLALEYLLSLYQQQKDWHQAIAIAESLTIKKESHKNMQLISHFNCELAAAALASGDYFMARAKIKLAHLADSQSGRVSLLLGQLEYQLGDYQAAINAYQQIEQQDPWLVPESLPTLLASFDKVNDEQALLSYLQRCLVKAPSVPVMQAIIERLQAAEHHDEAAGFMVEQLKAHPSLEGLKKLLDLHIVHSDGEIKKLLMQLRELMMKNIPARDEYCCKQCGYVAKKLHWLCPSCKQWGTIKSLQMVENNDSY